MKTTPEIEARISQKTNDELLEILRKPDDWQPDMVDAARAELQNRNVDITGVAPAVGQQKQAVACPKCGASNPKKRFFGGSKGGAIACFVLGGFFAVDELSRPGGDPTVLLLTAVFVLAGIAALTGKRYKCASCGTKFNAKR